jgi:hypothetical protein
VPVTIVSDAGVVREVEPEQKFRNTSGEIEDAGLVAFAAA